ncbi:LysR family transcriptional regulator [Symbiobacterium terraclitae]|uniref:LysR family transcriptional regulator n=1 Tax=Symbiobacterium terraclitae TaxID=557451 RepID=UPI0035B5045F
MNLHHIRYFVSVARHRSFTRAAAENMVAQPSLSQQIRRLEEELGAPLFDRSQTPVRLTDAGEALLPHAEAILRQVEAARAAVEERLGLRSGRLVLGSLPMTGSRLLPRAITAYRRRYPGIQVILREESTLRLTELALSGETDLTLTTLPPGSPDLDWQPLLTEPILLALPPDHPLAAAWRQQEGDRQQTVPAQGPTSNPADSAAQLPADLPGGSPPPCQAGAEGGASPHPPAGQPGVPLSAVADEPFLVMKPGYGFRDLVLAACHAAGFAPRIAFESAQIETLQAMVAAGLGVTLVPQMATDRSLNPSPAFVPLAGPPLTRTLALVWRRDRPLPRSAEAFLQLSSELWPSSHDFQRLPETWKAPSSS